MKLFFSVLRSIVIIFLMCLIVLYFILQTKWSAQFTAPFLSHINTPYQIKFTKITHSFAKPFQIKIDDLEIDNEQTQLLFNAKTAQIDFNKSHPLSTFNNMKYVDCNLTANQNNTMFLNNININQLNIKNCDINYKQDENNLTIANLSGEFVNWQGLNDFVTFKSDSKWEFTAKLITINEQLQINQFINKGFIENERVYLTQLGASTKWGSFLGKLNYKPKHSIIINTLQFYNLHYQANQTLQEFFDAAKNSVVFSFFDDLDWKINELSLTQSDLMLTDFNLEKAEVQLKKIDYHAKKWGFKNTSLFFNAHFLNWHQESFQQPYLQIESEEDHFYFKAYADWLEGNIQLVGDYQNKNLHFESINALNLRYNLLNSMFMQPDFIDLLNPLGQITLEHLTLFPSTIFYPNESFPFEFSKFELVGTDLSLNKNTENNFDLQGELNLNSEFGTINKVPVINPHLKIEFSKQYYRFELDTHFEVDDTKGAIDINGESTLPFNLANPVKLSIETDSMPDSTLKKWLSIANYPSNENYKIDLIDAWQNLIPINKQLLSEKK